LETHIEALGNKRETGGRLSTLRMVLAKLAISVLVIGYAAIAWGFFLLFAVIIAVFFVQTNDLVPWLLAATALAVLVYLILLILLWSDRDFR
jgi:hypothetical protein